MSISIAIKGASMAQDVIGGFVNAIRGIGSTPINGGLQGSGNPLPEIVDKVASGDLGGAANDTLKEISEESGKLAESATDWVQTSVINPATDWAKENITNPIGSAWAKYKWPIIGAVGTIAAIKILK